MRVAHVSDCYLPRTGGIELQVRGLSQAQLAAGESPLIITATPASRHQAVVPGETDHGVPIERLSVRLPAQLPVSPHVGRRLADLLKARADVVHVHGGSLAPFAWPALRTAVRAGLPAVVTVHSVWAGWAKWFAAADHVWGWRDWPVQWTAVSEVAAAGLRQALRGAADVRVLPNGIDVDAWRPLDDQPAAPTTQPDSGELVVVSVARFAPRKRMAPLVRLLSDAREALPDTVGLRAALIGDGPERNRVERMIKRRDAEWIQCLGWQTHDQIRSRYERADVFIAPAKYESFGIAALEARTSGLAVVALSDSGTASFIRDGKEGLLAEDDAGMAAALVRLASDPGVLAGIKAHNRGCVPEYAWPNIVGEADACYRAAIDLRRAP